MNASNTNVLPRFVLCPTAVLFLFFILFLVTCPLKGQELQKKTVSPADYDSFGNFLFHKPSKNGNWICFSMFYKNGRDTLFAKSTFSNETYYFPNGLKPEFLGNSNFVYQNTQGLHILNLMTGKEIAAFGISNYYYSQTLKKIILLTKPDSEKKQSLIVLDQKGQPIYRIENTTGIKMSPNGTKLIFTVDNQNSASIGILGLTGKIKIKWIGKAIPGNFKMLTWEKKERALSYLTVNNKGNKILYYFILQTDKLYSLNPKTVAGFPVGSQLGQRPEYGITISDDLQRIFFGITAEDELLPKIEPETDFQVEIWNSTAKTIYPMMKKSVPIEKQNRLAVWFPDKGKIMEVSTSKLPKVTLSGNSEYAVLSDPKKYEPQFEYDSPRDFYIMNLLTGEKDLFLQNKKITPDEPLPMCSPAGNYISYMMQDSCWIYNINTKKNINLTRKITAVTLMHRIQKNEKDFLLMPLGWTSSDNKIVLYDGYDIWISSPEGSSIERLTHGREKQIRFKLYESENFSGPERSYDGFIAKTINIFNGLLLKARGDDEKTGLFKWEKNKGETALVYGDFYIDKFYTADKEKKVFYQQQMFDQPPKIVALEEKKSRTVYQSSMYQRNFYWGRSSLLKYQDANGETMQSLLYYPAAYDPNKKYPMIVNIYEKQTQNIHKYIVPEWNNEAGFNPSVLAGQGYLVLCPDIISEKQNEGPSALHYTIAAVNEVIKRGLVKPEKIGLIGHSFGAYETVYIVTQTNIFAAAVAGAAITNISSYYHTVDWDTGRPSMNYFVNGQLKMIEPPSKIPEIYARNSPIEHISKITTPVLSYAGKDDNHVDWHQTVEFHMALRRLGKKNIMLLYPKEGHTITNPVNQKDLTLKISEWFDCYLKDKLPVQWIKEE